MEPTKHIFTINEKKCLRDIVKKYYSIVENKDIHTEAVKQKNITWQIIGDEYNACPHVSFHATPKQLRRLWLNLKQRSKAKTQSAILNSEVVSQSSESSITIDGDPLKTEFIQNESEIIQNNTNDVQNLICKVNQEECRRLEKHDLEMQILREQLREAKAKADLAELLYNQHCTNGKTLL